jgi:CBS domain containing-hemolysin-like protein
VRVDAGFPLEELNDRLRLGIEESGDYDTVGGYVHAMLGKIAEEGDSFNSGRVRWVVEKVKGRRIETVRLISEDPWPDESFEGTPHTGVLEDGAGHLS